MSEDPFSTLGLPAVFDIDQARVERAYLSRAAVLHPDVVGDDDDAAVRSAQLNRAKSVLANPEKRANALVSVLGGPSKEHDKSLPPGFLMEMMDTREAIEQALSTGAAAERQKWQDWAEHQRAEYTRRVAALFRSAEATRDPLALRAIRQELNAWRYIERLIEQLDPKYNPGVQDFVD